MTVKTTTLKMDNRILCYKFIREILVFSFVMSVFGVFLACPGIVIMIGGYHRIVAYCFIFVPVWAAERAIIVFIIVKVITHSIEIKKEPKIQKIEFGEKIVVSINDEVEAEHDYKDFFKITSSKNYYLLHLSKFKFFLIDKKDFSNDEINALQNKIKIVK